MRDQPDPGELAEEPPGPHDGPAFRVHELDRVQWRVSVQASQRVVYPVGVGLRARQVPVVGAGRGERAGTARVVADQMDLVPGLGGRACPRIDLRTGAAPGTVGQLARHVGDAHGKPRRSFPHVSELERTPSSLVCQGESCCANASDSERNWVVPDGNRAQGSSSTGSPTTTGPGTTVEP